MGIQEMESKPFTVIVSVEVNPDMIPQFLEVMAKDVEGSRAEEGCLRFDLLQVKDATNKFVFYETYKDAAALDVHKTTPHYAAWGEFKKIEGSVISQTAVKYDAINFQ